VAASPGAPPAPTSVFQIQPLHAQVAQARPGALSQAGVGSVVAPTFEVEPGPPPAPIGEPSWRRPVSPGKSRPALPDFESDGDAAALQIDPSIEPPIEVDRDTSGKKAGTEGERRP